MRLVNVRCVSLSPLLMDRMSPEVLDSLDTGVRLQEQKDRPPDDKAKPKIYLDTQGNIALPAEMMTSCLVGAGRNVKNGKKNISTLKDTTLFDLMSVEGSFLLLTNKQGDNLGDKSWVADRRRGIGNQAKTPTAVCITRPRFDEWYFEVTIRYDETKVNRDTVMKLFTVAGSSKGLGSYRPDKKGPFGRFKFIRWDESKLATNDEEVEIIIEGKKVTAA